MPAAGLRHSSASISDIADVNFSVSHPKTNPIAAQDIELILASCGAELAELRGKSILLTGATGFVGSSLLESIIASNATVSAADACRLYLPTRSVALAQKNWPQFFEQPHITWLEWAKLDTCCNSCDYIIHAASPTDPSSYQNEPLHTMNEIVSLTQRVLSFAVKTKVRRLLYVSSGAIYGCQPGDLQSIPEEYSGGPNLQDSRSCYGEAKRFSELLCQVSGIPTVVARLFTFIGPNQNLDGSFAAPDFIRQATTKHEIRIRDNGLSERTYCYSSDLVISIWKLLLRGEPGEAYNVGQSPPATTVLGLAQLIGQQVGGVEVIVEGTSGDKSRPRYIPDVGKLCQLYRPCITLPEAVERTLWSLYFNQRIAVSPSNSDLSKLLHRDCQG